MPTRGKRPTASDASGDPSAVKKLRQTVLDGGKKDVDSALWSVTDSLAIFTPPDTKNSAKVLALDMDGTIIVTASGRTFPKDANDWKIMLANIPAVLKHYDSEGFKVVILSNQSAFKKDRSKFPAFQVKVQDVVAKLGLPIQVFLSLQDDINRKPRTGMWQTLERQNGGVEIIKKDSIFCGGMPCHFAIFYHFFEV
uniref:Bifunctional polynucleotide phosphatase/kinase n=1 Tax=Schistocephalus solidus TaxID=70667 RepID=A0A0X3Q1N0_SCHSO